MFRGLQSQLVSPSLSYSIVVFSSLARFKYLSLFSLSLIFTLWSVGTAKSAIQQVFLWERGLLLTLPRSGRLAKIKWSVCTAKSQRGLCVSFSWAGFGLYIYHLLVVIIIIIIYSLRVFHMVFHWSLSDSKSPQVPMTLLNILAVLKKAVLWMISIHSPSSKSSSHFNNPLVTVPKAPITIGIIVTFMFHSFSIPSQGRGTYPSLHFLSVLFCGQPVHQNRQFFKYSFFFLLITIRSGLLAEIWWPVISLNLIGVCICHSPGRTDAGSCIHHLSASPNSNFLHISQ